MNEIESMVVPAANKLIEAKKIAPGSDNHIRVLSRLTKLLAENPDAIKALSKLQKEQ